MLISTNPATAKPIAKTAPMTDVERDAAIAQAASAGATWREQPFAERANVLNAVAACMRDNVENLAPLMTQEMGKPIREARGEVLKAAWCAEHYAAHAEKYLARQVIESDATLSYVQHLPLGVVLGILPWNAPFWLAFRFCAPALMAGNTCLLKHDPLVQQCARAIAALFHQAGAPAGLLTNLPLLNEQVVDVIRDARVRAISFTGSSAAGAQVAAAAAAEIKPAVLELGGSDPAIVLADADIEQAIKTLALSRMINAGQSCIAAKRLIVEVSIYDQFVARLRETLAALKMGDPAREDTDIGPIARADLRDNLHQQVQQTIEAGARCLLGGELPAGEGFYYPPTLLADVTEEMVACREETFGPVAVVIKAADADAALAIANRSEYGLAGSIWTSPARGEQLARLLEVGQVAVNGIVKTDPRLPSGGIKRSGYGRELGPHGIHEFVNAQQIWIGPAR